MTANVPHHDLSDDHLDSTREQYLKLKEVAIDLIDQAINLLNNVITNDTLLTTVSNLVPGSTTGKHLRHLHDHFRILFEFVTSQSPSNVLNYDARQRNIPMEACHQVAVEEFLKLKWKYLQDPFCPFNQIDKSNKDQSPNGSFNHSRPIDLLATTPYKVLLKTNFNRELWFACLHATHHYALIRVIATAELNLELPREFGVAPSTLQSQKSKY